ncbi:MAG: homocysteine methyltransferase [Ruminococcaceae bacterium]|nr:homocysteine methyltransferase [Oscillospiraceae bacterium]
MNIREYLKDHVVYLDGGMGTLLQQRGLAPGEYPELWNLSHPEVIVDIHKAYFDAGSNIVCTNTFGANPLKFSYDQLKEIITAAVNNAKAAAVASCGKQEKFVALDIGPSGKLLKPYGDLDFEDAVTLFSKVVKIGSECGVDLVYIETFSDSYETKAALLAAKENCNLPVFVSNAYGEDGKLMTGASPEVMVAMIEGMGADAVGANCSVGPDKLVQVAKRLYESCSLPVLIKPNAGLPKGLCGETVYDVSPDAFSDVMQEIIKNYCRIVGGCCGTTPDYIKSLCDKTASFSPVPIKENYKTVVTSYAKTVVWGENPVLIGERINPTGKKRFKQALIDNDISYILNEGVNQQEKGVHILDVNVGIPDIDEKKVLTTAICELQAVTDLPLQIDTSSPDAMEMALRRYNGKAMINSVNGKIGSMEKIFPLVKKYGGVVVALTLDETGIPDSAQGRIDIAKRILEKAHEYGISKKDIIFDTLAMTVSADSKAPGETLAALRYIKNEMGCHTSLGVSNVSFGLPSRDAVNSTFFAMALENGLSAAIMNPYSLEMMKTYHAFCALHGLDENCASYIDFMSSVQSVVQPVISQLPTVQVPAGSEDMSPLKKAIIRGMKDDAKVSTKALLNDMAALDIVNQEIIPALDEVGKGYENKSVYLPQLLMSAEAAKSAFECIKEKVDSSKEPSAKKGDFVIATVHGDIHDIGKNIVKLLLENYGFAVHDLGRDVPPQVIVDEVVKTKTRLVGLSALMTTTVPAMEETIKILRTEAPWCKIVVGGAVLTREYADSIGADKYAKDAMETVRYAEKIISEK